MFAMAVLLIMLLSMLLYLGTRKPKGYPPGPKWWPILGCAVEMARMKKATGYLFKTCSDLSKQYGPVIGLKLGKDYIVVVNDYESIREVLMNTDFDGRPIGLMYKTRTFGLRRGLIVVDEDFWVEQRRFVLRHLREFGFGRNSMTTALEFEAFNLVKHIKNLMHKEHNKRANDISIPYNNNDHDNGQIYKLAKEKSKEESPLESLDNSSSIKKMPKATDLYVNANDYEEVRRMSQSSGVVIPMDTAFGVSVLNSIWTMITGKRFNHGDEKLLHLQSILAKVLEESDMIGAVFGHFPVLSYIAPEKSGYKCFLQTHQHLWKFLKEELENHKNTYQEDSPRDLIDVYLTALKSGNCGDSFSESQLLGICVDLFIAGSETTAKTLAFCFLYLILNPHVQKKAQEEIDRVIGRNKYPTIADKIKMTYVNAIVLESLRMFVGRTLNVPHRALKETSIKGYRIPKDTMIVANFNGILMSESWIDPESFRPERFLDDSGNVLVPSTFFPFSIGRHRCIGESLAKSNIFTITTTLLQTFTFSVVPGEEKPSCQDFIDGVTAGPAPFRALVTLRT